MKLSTLSSLLFANSALAFSFYGSSFDYARSSVEMGAAARLSRSRPLSARDTTVNLTQAQAIAGYSAACAAITDPSIGLPAVQADINNVTVNSLAIEAQFRDVLAQLTAIDNKNLTAQKFAPGWNVLYGQWTDILWASRNTASDTVVYAQNFVDTIMPFVANTSGPNCPPSLGVEVLNEYILEAQNLKGNAMITSQNFTDLQTALVVFSASFQNFALQEGQFASGNLTILQGEVAGLVAQIAVLTDQIVALGIALGISIFAEVGILALLPVAGPYAIALGIAAVVNAGAIIGEAVALGVLISQRSSLEAKRDNDIFQINQLEKTLAQIASANQTLATIANQTIPTLVTQLGAFNHIWDAVVNDASQAIGYLNMLTSPIDQRIPQIFWSTANHVPCIYEALIPALNNYAVGITNSGIPAPSATVSKAIDHVQFRAKALIVTKAQSRVASLQSVPALAL